MKKDCLGKISIDKSGEETEQCEWTLENYIKLTRVKHPSKAKFFIVKKLVFINAVLTKLYYT